MKYLNIFLTSIFLALPQLSIAIDCTHKTTEIDHRICSDVKLLQLDAILNQTYQSTSNTHEKLLKRQKQWLFNRNQCSNLECLISQYLLRINELVYPQQFIFLSPKKSNFNISIFATPDDSVYDCDTSNKAHTTIFRDTQLHPIQDLVIQGIIINYALTPPSLENIPLYSNEGVLMSFKDFNFDGYDDIEISDSYCAGYGATTSSFYVYNPLTQQFDFNAALTNLSHSTNLGIVAPNPQNKTLTTYEKSGAAWHETAIYQWENNDLKLIKIITEDGITNPNEFKTTTKILIDGVWQTTIDIKNRE